MQLVSGLHVLLLTCGLVGCSIICPCTLKGRGRITHRDNSRAETYHCASSRGRKRLISTPTRRNGDLLCLPSVCVFAGSGDRRSYVGRLVEDHNAGNRLINSNMDLSQLVILLLLLLMMMMMMVVVVVMTMTGHCDVTPALVSQQI